VIKEIARQLNAITRVEYRYSTTQQL